MTAGTDALIQAFRLWVTDNVPASGANWPNKAEIIAGLTRLAVDIGAAQAGLATVSNIAARDTFYADTANRGKLVYVNNNNGSATDPANGVYEYVSGSARLAQGFYAGVASVVQPLVDQAAASAASAASSAATTATALDQRIPANTSANTKFFRGFKMGKKYVLWFNAAGETALRPAKETIDRVISGLIGRVSSAAQTRFRPIAKRGRAWVLWDDNGILEFPRVTTRTLAYLTKALNIGSGSAAQTTGYIGNIYGQSVAAGSLSYSMTWRPPWQSWGAYPPGFSGESDGPSFITTTQVGNNRTLSADRTGLAPLAGNPVYGLASEGIGHGMLDFIATKYPGTQLVALGNPVGGVPISYLDKPSTAEISAGATFSNNPAEVIAIPTTSAEYQMQTANQNMGRVLDYDFTACATPYFKNMWLIAKAASLLVAEGKAPRVFQAWMHGQANSSDADYASKVNALYDQQKIDIRFITGQTDFIMLLNEPQYSPMAEQQGQSGYDTWAANGYAASYAPGGANSAYTPEANRTNNYIDLNVRQTKITDEALSITPARRIYNVGPDYCLSSLVHLHPHAARNAGEIFGKVFCKVEIEKQGWKPLQPISYWFDATSIYVRFHVPRGRIQFLASPNAAPAKAGKPYGFELRAGSTNPSSPEDIIPIQSGNVKILGNDLLQLTPDVAPASGQRFSYVNSCRTGDLCDQDDTVPIYTDRSGAANVTRDYGNPFNITLTPSDRR